ncbi:hypothetical protein B0H10DRAFT_1975109 [Mycena sp. CBHHK59/15]|nr:hypothetical protein B0H10DRAFT_1975109 [Mycena sp. CBHHK59/15]
MKSSTHLITASIPWERKILQIASATLPKIAGVEQSPKQKTWSMITISFQDKQKKGQCGRINVPGRETSWYEAERWYLAFKTKWRAWKHFHIPTIQLYHTGLRSGTEFGEMQHQRQKLKLQYPSGHMLQGENSRKTCPKSSRIWCLHHAAARKGVTIGKGSPGARLCTVSPPTKRAAVREGAVTCRLPTTAWAIEHKTVEDAVMVPCIIPILGEPNGVISALLRLVPALAAINAVASSSVESNKAWSEALAATEAALHTRYPAAFKNPDDGMGVDQDVRVKFLEGVGEHRAPDIATLLEEAARKRGGRISQKNIWKDRPKCTQYGAERHEHRPKEGTQKQPKDAKTTK